MDVLTKCAIKLVSRIKAGIHAAVAISIADQMVREYLHGHPEYNFIFKTRRVPIHCMYDIRNGQPIWCKVENVIHNFGHHAVEIDENRIFIMDVHQTVLITEVYFQI